MIYNRKYFNNCKLKFIIMYSFEILFLVMIVAIREHLNVTTFVHIKYLLRKLTISTYNNIIYCFLHNCSF